MASLLNPKKYHHKLIKTFGLHALIVLLPQKILAIFRGETNKDGTCYMKGVYLGRNLDNSRNRHPN